MNMIMDRILSCRVLSYNTIRLFWGGVIFFVLLSCSRDEIINIDDGEQIEPPTSIQLIDGDGNCYLPFLITDDAIHIQVPNQLDLTALTIRAVDNSNESFLRLNKGLFNKALDMTDFTAPYNCYSIVNGVETRRKIVLHNLPVLCIDTPGGAAISSRTERLEGCKVSLVEVNDSLFSFVSDLGVAGIRGRGQSSWNQPKKPYNIKFDKKVSILGMKASKHWQLLANAYFDRSQIRNATAFEVARQTDFDWVQSGRYVELILNGTHVGLYYLCEKIRVEKEKIDIDSNTSLADKSFLLESFVCGDSEYPTVTFTQNMFNTGVITTTGDARFPCVLSWEIKDPDEDELTDGYVNEVKRELQNVETAIKQFETGEYLNYFDIESAIDWYLVEEVCLNEEACRSKNLYLYRNSGSKAKVKVGPPWDFDAWSFGQYGVEFRNWTMRPALYYSYLLQDPVFIERLKEKWVKYRPIWEYRIPIYIEKLYNELKFRK